MGKIYQITLCTIYQKTVKYARWQQNRPNGQKIPTSFIATPSKIFPNWYFWFENKPSGNPAAHDKY
jgi:hypothetical protein